jgi:hypothetical protein
MCMVVYVASDYPLPMLAWDQTNPQFHVTELSERTEPVRRHFTKPCVYYVGSHEMCGCGFQYGEYEGYEEEADLPAKRESRRRLAEFLSVALQHQPAVEVYACWDGDEGLAPDHTGRVRPSELVQSRTFFREREFLVVSEQGAEPNAAPAHSEHNR